MKENVIVQDVYLLEVKALDFKDNDGKKICGYSVFYYRDFSDREKDSNSCGKKVEKIFIVKDSIDDLDKYKNKIYPCKAQVQFEFVSLDKKPKPIKIII